MALFVVQMSVGSVDQMREVGKLSARTVTGSLAAGKYGDGNGLYLTVSKTGAKSWLLIYRAPKGPPLRRAACAPAKTRLPGRAILRTCCQHDPSSRAGITRRCPTATLPP